MIPLCSRLFVLFALFSSLSQGKLFRPNREFAWHSHEHQAFESQVGDAPKQYFNQYCDHFDEQNSDTFQQLYFVNATWATGPDSPVFLFIGGEGTLRSSTVSRYIVSNYAEKFGAMVVSLEHRFYGESIPYGSSSVKNLRLLSSQQALADLANFRNFIVKDMRLSESAKWVVFGGSYAGNLAAWFRMKYPHLAVGAIATSGPVKAQLDFPEYMQVVATSIGPECNAALTNATRQMEAMIQTSSGREELTRRWNLCEAPATVDDVSLFFSDTSDPICGIVQYNNDNINQPTNIPGMCDIILSESDPIQGWINFYNFYYGGSTECIDVNYNNYIKSMGPDSAARSWVYQTCTEFGYYQTGERSDQPFSSAISLDWFVGMCADIYGIPGMTPDIDWTNTYYGSTDIEVTNVVFPDGTVDPWHILALLESHIPSSPAIFMTGTAHCADLYQPSPNDPQDLTNCRTEEINNIGKWLA